MRKTISTLIITFMLAGAAFAQASPATPVQPAAKKSAKKARTAKKAAPATPAIPAQPSQSVPAGKVTHTGANPEAIFDTSVGQMKCELFPKQAPKTVANFVALATGNKEWTHPWKGEKMKTPLFSGTIFHRVIPNFMIQGGDPIGNGTGGPGYRFEDEFSPTLRFDKPGRLAMANSGPGTNGSQFFITEVPTPHLNDRHTIFGQCDDASVALVKQIARVAADPRNNRPLEDVKLNSITILGMEPPKAAKPAAKSPAKKAAPAKKATPAKKAIPATQ